MASRALSKLKLVTFDITNTLLKVKGSVAEQYAEAAKIHGVDIDFKAIDKVYDQTWMEKKSLHPNYGQALGMTNEEWWGDFVKSVLIRAGYKGDPLKLDKVAESLDTQFCEGGNWEALPHAHEVLQSIKVHDVKLAVVSNFDNRLEQTLKKQDMMAYFDFLVTPVNSHAEKPDSKIFHFALDLAKVTASEAVHIGDDLINDYWGARSIGIDAYLLNSSGKYSSTDLKDVNPSRIVQNLKQFKPLSLMSD